jgi:hypothetical protein
LRPYKVKGKVVMRTFPLLKLHDLRDTFGTYQMMNPKNSPREVQEWMGHASLTTTQRYAKFRPLTDAAERMGASFADRPSGADTSQVAESSPESGESPAEPETEPTSPTATLGH